MTDLTQMIRWKAGFVRGLAQSVLARAKNIREALDQSVAKTAEPSPRKVNAKKKPGKKTSARPARKTKRKHA